jgi:superfamily II DNA or RNA helicase
MATGTGKTKTSLKIIEKLVKEKKITIVIIATEGNDLLNQWLIQIVNLIRENNNELRVYKQFNNYKEIHNFLLDKEDAILITSNENLNKALKNFSDSEKSKCLLIHDEVHRVGSPQNRRLLEGLSLNIEYVLGLSATPEREYDSEGNLFIEKYIGPVIFEYGLEDAIKDGILCQFKYIPITYQSTQDDRNKVSAVYSQKAARAAEGRAMSEEEIAIAISKVYKLSKAKIPLFKKYVAEHKEILKRSIIFVEEISYGEEVLEIIHQYRNDFHTYYADDQVDTLKRFANGELECLVTCHKVSEGIDIKSLENVVLFSSAKARLETIQRIGRCLRVDPQNPKKIATVVDFIRSDEKRSYDQDREEWLKNLSNIKVR